jgi:hypothetical protein
MRITGTAVLASALVLLGGAPAVLAAASWLQRAADAPLQVVAVCQSRTSRWEGGSIYSYSETSVSRTIHGTAPATLVVRQRGGEVDGIAQRVTHASLLEPGRSYVLLLGKDETSSWTPNSTGVNPIVAASDGTQTIGGEPLDEVLAALGAGN